MRSFTAADQTRVRDLVLSGLRERWDATFDPDANPDLDDISSFYVDRGADVVVIEVDDRIVATGTLIPLSSCRGRIVRMSVDREYRRKGLAREVVAELVRRAIDQQLTEVVVLTDAPWTSACALYLACGFVQVGQDETDTHFAMSPVG